MNDKEKKVCIRIMDKYAKKNKDSVDEYNKIIEKGKNKVKGYELLSNIKKSKVYNAPVEKIQTLYEIWHGEEINKVRKKHVLNKVEQVEICRNCSFKDTYEWFPVKSSSINYEL